MTFINIVKKLISQCKTISTMESCTGGYIASSITNIPGASEILKFSAVTYSNEYKIKMGVSSDVIDEYSVYSIETANEMSKNISNFSNSNYGIGITGKLCSPDPVNPTDKNDIVYISIYNKDLDKYYEYSLEVKNQERYKNKELILEFIVDKLREIV